MEGIFFLLLVAAVFIGLVIKFSSPSKEPPLQPPRPRSSATRSSTPSPPPVSTPSKLSKVRSSTIKLAMQMAANSGTFNPAKAEVVKSWAERIVSMAHGDRKEEKKSELNAAIKKSYDLVRLGGSSLQALCDSLSRHATDLQKKEAFKLCIEVVSTGGEPGESDRKALKSIISYLGLSPDRYKDLLTSVGAPVVVQKEPAADLDVVIDPYIVAPSESGLSREAEELMRELGLHPGMNKEELKNKVLVWERKWRSRQNHPDPGIRTEAKKKLLLIGEIRSKMSS